MFRCDFADHYTDDSGNRIDDWYCDERGDAAVDRGALEALTTKLDAKGKGALADELRARARTLEPPRPGASP